MTTKPGIIKRNGKVLMSFLLVFSLVLTTIPVVPAHAEGTTTLMVESTSATAGETVTVDVSIADCPNCYAITLIISYDTTAMTLTHIARGPATDPSEADFLGNPSDVNNPDTGKILIDGRLTDGSTFYMPVGDGVLFTLTFAVKPTAGSGDYEITVSNDGFFDPNSQVLPISITNGVMSVTGDPTVGHEASYKGKEYLTLDSAFAAALQDGTGTITMINDATIEDCIIIPANADITLDMNGHTITSEKRSDSGWNCTVEVQEFGKLNLVDNSVAKGGKFVSGNYCSGPFLVNSGTLNMSNVGVIGFYKGILDGSSDINMGVAGTYGTINNCKFVYDGFTDGYIIDLHNANVGTIKDCTIQTSQHSISIGAGGTINLLEDCTINGDNDENGMIRVSGTIETIRDCTIAAGDEWRVVINNDGGTIGKITSTSADKHTTIHGRVWNSGTIGLIESDYTLFKCISAYNNIDNYVDNGVGVIETISGGTFNSGRLPIYVGEGTRIGTISGGTFRSGQFAAVQNDGTIDSITGGIFIGGPESNALYLGKIGASIGSITGGYYKNTSSASDLIYAVEGATINIPEGYGFGTEETINEESGFYRLGEIVEITWIVDGVEETEVLFSGDPVSYSGDTPTKIGEGYTYVFKGWSDGETLYGSSELPNATENVTYTAVFDEIAPEDDYMVSLATEAENINAGEDFTVDVKITSNDNNSFYGATIEVTYDNSQVDYNCATNIPESFGITPSTSGTITTLKIVGAAQSGYTMTDHAYTVATLSFTANSDISTGTATFGIKDNPIVDQQYAVHSQAVTAGDDISVNLWNLTVTFQAGANVTMATGTAYVKYNTAGLYTDTTYGVSFTEPVPVAADHYTLDDPVWYLGSGSNVSYDTILGTAFSSNAVYTATASPSSFAVTLPEDVNPISGITDGKATYLTDIVFTVDEVPGYVNVVTYTAGDGESVTLTADVEGKYTIPGNVIVDSITVNVEHVVHGTVTFIPNDNFKSLPSGHKVLVLTVSDKLSTGAYEYDSNAMFYSGEYSTAGSQVYVYVVPNEVTTEGALPKLQINKAVDPCIELAYDGDANLDGNINSTDAVLTYALYGGIWANDVFAKVDMQMRLEADVNGDGTVDTSDALAILQSIWGTTQE